MSIRLGLFYAKSSRNRVRRTIIFIFFVLLFLKLVLHTVQLNKNHFKKINLSLTCTCHSYLRGAGSNGFEGIVHSLQISRDLITLKMRILCTINAIL